LFKPSTEFVAGALLSDPQRYHQMYQQSITDPDTFWGNIASDFRWRKPWDRVCNQDNPSAAKWFDGGQLNITDNCLDRHLETARKNKAALIWEGEPGDRRVLTYLDLYYEVCVCAKMLKNLGVNKGDRVVIYLPMIPELPIAMLACARIGAIHSVVFAGFSAHALVDRVNDCNATVMITADGSYRRGKVLALKNIVDEALSTTTVVKHCVVVKRANCQHEMTANRDYYWQELQQTIEGPCPAETMDANDPLFILYTSGSTGKPKGIQHSIAGYMVGVATTTKYVFDVKEDDTYWCTADIGWVTGHSYLVYGPLLNGASVLMYEGAPDWPQVDRFWQLIARYQVNVFYTAPTAIRTFMEWGKQWPARHDLSSLRLLGSVGEPINSAAWMWYYQYIGQQRCPIVDTWWQTETGAIMLTPLPGITATRPGSATIPFFGVDPLIVDEQGEPVADGQGGLLVFKQSWPSILTTIWGNDKGFQQVYWQRFQQQGYYLAGDAAVRDEDGYFTILGRIDDVINVSGHRLSTMELESVLDAHELVAEAAVVGYPHAIKGEAIAAYVVSTQETPPDAYLLSTHEAPSNEEEQALLRQYIAEEIGSFAKPDRIHFVPVLPKTRSGKIMRRLLKDIAAGRAVSGDLSTIEDKEALEQLIEENAK